MKQYNYLVVFSCAPSGIGSTYITLKSKLDNCEKLIELANWIENKNNIKNVAIVNFQLVNISRVKRRIENERHFIQRQTSR